MMIEDKETIKLKKDIAKDPISSVNTQQQGFLTNNLSILLGSIVSRYDANGLFLNSETFTDSQYVMPWNGILQVAYGLRTNEFSDTSYSTDQFIFQAEITPKRTDSTIIALAFVNAIDNGGSGRVILFLKSDTTSGGTTGTNISSTAIAQDSAGTSGLSACTMIGAHVPASLTKRYYKLVGQKGDSGTTWYVNHYGGTSGILLVEYLA